MRVGPFCLSQEVVAEMCQTRLRRIDVLHAVIAVGVLGAAMGVWSWSENQRPPNQAIGGIVGALIAASVFFVGNGIKGWSDWRERDEQRKEKRDKLATLITSELHNLMIGHLDVLKELKAHIAVLAQGQTTMGGYAPRSTFPRSVSVIDQFGDSWWLLKNDEIAAITALRQNLSITKDAFAERRSFTVLEAERLAGAVQSDLGQLSEVFEKIAPDHELREAEKTPERATVLLRRLSQERLR